MAYQSMFASNAQAASSNKKGVVKTDPSTKGYQSMFGFNTAGLGEQSAQISRQADADRKRKKQQEDEQRRQQAQQKQQGSLFNKVKSFTKDVASGAITGEREFAKGITRVAPGGTADISANVKQSDQAARTAIEANRQLRAGKLSKQGAQRITSQQAGNTDATVKTQKAIEKSMPTKKSIALGAASTAADIATAGTFGKIKGGAKAGYTAGKEVVPLALKGGAKAKTAQVVTGRLAANATAGSLNAAAGGGNKKDIAKNAILGAAFPEALHLTGTAGAKGASLLSKKVSSKDAKALLETTKRQSLLEKSKTAADLPPEPGDVIRPQVNSVPHNVLAEAQANKLSTIHGPDGAPIQPLSHAAAAPTERQVLPSEVSSTHITDEHPAVQAIQQHMAENYKPSTGHPDEAYAAEHLQQNTAKALKTYQDRTEKVFGSKNIVGGDDAKYAVPNMEANKSVNYHEPASQFAKGYYKHLLTDPETTHKPVMITAGGTGAGKTSALKKYFVDNGGDANDYAAIVDTNLTNLSSATSRIEPALATGHAVHVKFVYRDPVEAFQNGVIPRAAKEGRAVEASTHAETHAGSLDAIKQIADKYKDNPKVHVEIIDNSRGPNNSKEVMLDFLHDKSYTKEEIEQKIHDLLDSHLKEGKLTNEQHTIFKGKDEPIAKPAGTTAAKTDAVGETGHDNGRVEPQGNAKDGSQPQQERQSGAVKAPEQVSKDEIDSVHSDVQAALEENGVDDASIVDIKQIGSTAKGTHTSNSDLDFMVVYDGEARPDNLFNILADYAEENGLELNGRKIDFNPVHKDDTKEIESLLKGTYHDIPKPKADNVPTISAFGKKIKLTEENGYIAVPTAVKDIDGNNVNIYRKTHNTSTNGKGHNTKTDYWYDSNGIKLTEAQAHAAIEGNATMTGYKAPSKPEVKAPEAPKPIPKASLLDKKPAPKPEAKPEKIALKPHETAHMEEVGGYTHSTHMEQDYADMLREQERNVKGGEKVKNADGSYKRTSEHSRFYRDYYKEFKKPPTKEAYLEEAQRQLASGKGAYGASDDYKTLLEREGRPIPRIKVAPAQTKIAGPQVTPMVAKRIARDIKENYGDLSTVDKVSIEDQTNKAVKLISNREDLDAVIAGTKPLPDGLRATSIITAIRHDPVLSKDAELLLKVANSPLSKEASLSAQELRLARENAKDDPVFSIRKLSEARKQAFEAKSKQTAVKAVQSEVQAIRQATPKITKESWSSFVDSLRC